MRCKNNVFQKHSCRDPAGSRPGVFVPMMAADEDIGLLGFDDANVLSKRDRDAGISLPHAISLLRAVAACSSLRVANTQTMYAS